MRTRLASVATAILLASAAFSETAGTALMAAQPTVGATCSSDNGLVIVSFIYDASKTPPPVTTVEIANTDTKSVPVGVTFYDLQTTTNVVWSGSRTFAPGTTTLDVSGLGAHMWAFTNKFGTSWAFPVAVSCA